MSQRCHFRTHAPQQMDRYSSIALARIRTAGRATATHARLSPRFLASLRLQTFKLLNPRKRVSMIMAASQSG